MNIAIQHILLGAGGSISIGLTRELLDRKQPVKWVSRTGRMHEGVEPLRTDLLDAAAVRSAVDEGSRVYLLAGLKYRTAVWRDQWPRVMRNVIEACSAKDASLVFFDNVYMYGKVTGPMTESTPVNPCSRKGEVRAAIAADLLAAHRSGKLKALIARSADFYGPHAEGTSILNMLVLSKAVQGKNAQWLGNPDAKHAYTYTGDCGKALYLLGGDPEAFGQVWHLPTPRALTGREFIAMAAQVSGAKGRFSTLPKWMLRAGSLFDPTLGESLEMFYQYESDYEFDSSRFTGRYRVQPTSYEDGMKATLDWMRNKGNESGWFYPLKRRVNS